MTVPRLLIIAGSDSGGGAGIQADIKTATMFGVHAMTALTALTAQNSLGVQQVMTVPVDMVLAQMDSVLADLGADAVKIGMIGSAEIANAVADRLARLDVPIVFDPVMVATSGSVLADPATIAAFERLLGLATVTTPNLPELEVMAGAAIGGTDEMEAQAHRLARRHGRFILAKGGHLEGEALTDLLVGPDGAVQSWTSPRRDTRHSHGTGCTLATAIACGLAAGRPLPDSVADARLYVQGALEAAPGLGAGHGPIGHMLGAEPWRLIHKDLGPGGR